MEWYWVILLNLRIERLMPTTSFAVLSWNDLEQWAGPTILERGKNYRHRVHNLGVTDENHLVATVAGSGPYITRVWLNDDEPDYECSCPYWGPCKHAVAVILAYLDCIKSELPVPLIEPGELDARLSVYVLADEQGSDVDIDVEEARTALKAMTKAQLIEWVMDVSTDHPFIFDSLACAAPPGDIAVDKTVARLRQQIRKTGDERGWQDYWNDDGYTPDYSPIQKQLEKLLNGGHIEAILDLGEELFSLGITQVGESDDEGETATEIAGCLAVVFAAMSKSRRPPAQRMIWYWDKVLQDDYGLLDELESPIDYRVMKQADWNEVVEEFNKRLENCPRPKVDSTGFSDKYHRQRLLGFTLEALSQAGEPERATELMIAELPYCDNYVEVVDYLLASNAFDQAEHWAYQGFHKTIDSLPGIAWKLVEQLLNMAVKRKDWPQVAALRVDTFFQDTSVDHYRLAQKSSQKCGCWTQIQAELLCYLETGISPLSAADWPLPGTGLKFPKPKFRKSFPDFQALIAIALYEKRIEDALHWYQKTGDKSYHAEAIAKAVQRTNPDVSLGIWQGKVEAFIAKVKPGAYREAMPYLLKIQKLMLSSGRDDDYHRYIATIRKQHKAKRRLMEELDTLENKSRKNRPILED
jgi:uncharacterized Zn finger protein